MSKTGPTKVWQDFRTAPLCIHYMDKENNGVNIRKLLICNYGYVLKEYAIVLEILPQAAGPDGKIKFC